MRFIVFLFVSINLLYAIKDISPTYTLKASGNVQALIYEKSRLYTATDSGTIEIFDTSKKQKIKTIKLPVIKDFMGDDIPAKVYSIDKFKDKILIVSQGMKGYRNLWVYENDSLKKIINISKKYYLQKGAFIDESKALLALLSNQVFIYDIKAKKLKKEIQVSSSSFSHFMINEDKTLFASTDESGIVRVFYTKDLSLKEKLKSKNVDRVFQVDFKNQKILTAGQDRRSVFYDKGSNYYLEFDFLLYSCALSKDGKLAAVAYDEQANILVFNTDTQDKLYNLKDSEATLNQILFVNKSELFSISEHNNINFWKLEQ